MMNLRLATPMLLVIWLSFPNTTFSYPVEFVFTGAIDTVVDPNGAIPGWLTPGSRFTGDMTYDPAIVVDAEPQFPQSGLYLLDSVLTIYLDQSTIETENPAIVVANDRLIDDPDRGPYLRDIFLVTNSSGVPWWEDYHIAQMAVTLYDNNGDVFDSDALPLPHDNLSLDDFPSHAGLYFGGIVDGPSHDSFSVTGSLDTIQFVPEPATLTMLLAGCFCLRLRRRYRG
ncbi:MAG: PEP-CTERM sorting domain-containing protein [Planctomycetota bacterium]|jgi:hypothetical protein